MDGDAFRETVETNARTHLDRLGSSKLLVALTDATLSPAAVLDVAAHSEHAARETFRAWTADEADADARAAFEAVAEQEAEHLERVLAATDVPGAFDPGPEPGPMHAYLRGREGAIERVAGGMVGRALVSLRTHTQIVSFFVDEADEARADLFRDLKAETAAVRDDGLALLESHCETAEDWERARMVAEYTIRTAYDDYADTLRGMGVEPKSIC